MKKCQLFFWMMILGVLVVACNNVVEDTGSKDVDIPPGETYTAQGKYHLNVVYFIPSDLDTLPLWHKRLSKITLYAQEFYLQSMKRYGFEKTFNLEVNDDNPEYIRIRCIRSDKSVTDLKTCGDITQEVRAYFKGNPAELNSNHFLVYIPQYDHSSAITGAAIEKMNASSDVYDCGMCVFGYDTETFDIRHIISDRARKRFLPYLGDLLQDLGSSFFLLPAAERASDPFYSIMGDNLSKFIGFGTTKRNPDSFRLSASDAMSLSEIQVFNDIDREYYQERPEVTVEKWDLEFRNDTVFVACEYRTPDEVVGIIIYNDLWRSYTGNIFTDEDHLSSTSLASARDAMPYLIEDYFIEQLDGDLYRASITFPWTDVPIAWIATKEAEIRARFIMKGGTFYPHTGDVNIKGDAAMRRSFSLDWSIGAKPDFSVPDRVVE